MPDPKLLLFDIDGTLLNSGGAGKRAMNRAFEVIWGIQDALDGVDLAGRTDEEIFRNALKKFHPELNAELVTNFKKQYFALLPDEINFRSPGKFLYPGVLELLIAIRQQPTLVCGLLTGNWEQSARIKLSALSIVDFFELGAYADDSADRNELVPFAVARMHQARGYAPDSKSVYVIGDTPFDVACAHRHNAIAIAVASSSYSMEQLQTTGPDYLLENLSDTSKVMDIFLNSHCAHKKE